MALRIPIPTTVVLSALAATAPLVAPLTAQDTLAALQQKFIQEREELQRSRGAEFRFEDVRELAAKHAAELERWLDGERSDADEVNGRLMLTEIYLSSGREEDGRRTLRSIDTATAPPVELAAAAEMATMLGMADEREAFVAAAIDKRDAPFEQRMALGIVLATRLGEVARSEALFEREAAAANDAEKRAEVAWYRCAAIREREDLAEGAFEEALEEMAKEHADTYWGGVAKDRRKAFDLRAGSDAIAFTGKTLAGDTVTLAGLRGKVVLVEFWGSWNLGRGDATPFLKELLEAHGDDGLVVLGVALDEERARAVRAQNEAGKEWPQIWDGRGFRTDVALRYGIEQAPDYLLIDRAGKVVLPPLQVYLRDDIGRRELRDAVQRALAN